MCVTWPIRTRHGGLERDESTNFIICLHRTLWDVARSNGGFARRKMNSSVARKIRDTTPVRPGIRAAWRAFLLPFPSPSAPIPPNARPFLLLCTLLPLGPGCCQIWALRGPDVRRQPCSRRVLPPVCSTGAAPRWNLPPAPLAPTSEVTSIHSPLLCTISRGWLVLNSRRSPKAFIPPLGYP